MQVKVLPKSIHRIVKIIKRPATSSGVLIRHLFIINLKLEMDRGGFINRACSSSSKRVVYFDAGAYRFPFRRERKIRLLKGL
jgi:hypothetical protein